MTLTLELKVRRLDADPSVVPEESNLDSGL